MNFMIGANKNNETSNASGYYACGGCRKEFFSKDEYEKHECVVSKKKTSIDPTGNYHSIIRQGIIKDSSSSNIPDNYSRNLDYMKDVIEGNPEDPIVSHQNIDMRLSMNQEITNMKVEMSRAGILCNMMNAEETKSAYEKFKKKDSKNNPDEEKPARGRKSKQ